MACANTETNQHRQQRCPVVKENFCTVVDCIDAHRGGCASHCFTHCCLHPAIWSLLSQSDPDPFTTQAPLPCLIPQVLPSPSAMHPLSSFICLVGTAVEVMTHRSEDNKQTRASLPSLTEAKLMSAIVQEASWLPVLGNQVKPSRQWLRSPAVSSPGAGPHLEPWQASGCDHCLYLPPAVLLLPAPSAQPAANDGHLFTARELNSESQGKLGPNLASSQASLYSIFFSRQ